MNNEKEFVFVNWVGRKGLDGPFYSTSDPKFPQLISPKAVAVDGGGNWSRNANCIQLAKLPKVILAILAAFKEFQLIGTMCVGLPPV